MRDLERMLRDIRREVELTRLMIGRDQFDDRVMEAIGKVPRHVFVAPELQRYAYDNGPLPIGHGQTISQPYIVALMSDLAGLSPDCRVLEVGTGCGYQTAVLAELAAEVYSVEIIPALAQSAAELLKKLGYSNVQARLADGYHGWPEYAPFDAILVTAAAPEIPQPLVDQLKPGGRLVIPLGRSDFGQELQLLEKDGAGRLKTTTVLPVAFVPLTRSR